VSRIFDGEKEAKLIALACSKPPQGRTRWTLRLLENKVVELGIVERASDTTIGRALKKQSQAASPAVLGHPNQGQCRLRSGDGRTPAGLSGRDLKATHCREQLIAETRAPIAMKAGRPLRHDYEYERNGTANLFMLFAPLEGWRHINATDPIPPSNTRRS
jgi:hypothetical protein